ncbi:MAG: FG-GAP-like repeat-containing protein [Caldilineaceae bacterium]
MHKFRKVILIVIPFLCFALLWWTESAFAKTTAAPLSQGGFTITTTNPGDLQQSISLTNTIQATFNHAVNAATVTAQTFIVQGSQQGRLSGAYSFANGAQTVIFTPDQAFKQGEVITIIATNAIKDGSNVALTPYQWRFTANHLERRCIEGFLHNERDFNEVWSSSAAWGDYDLDGDLDAIVTGQPETLRETRLYRNDGETGFTALDLGLPGVQEGSLAWGDYDNDGDLDLLLAGNSLFGLITRVYRNDRNNIFQNTNASLLGIWLGEATWVDYNNDGFLDIFVTGQSDAGLTSRLYRNDGHGGFLPSSASFTGVNNASADWADYDNDGDADLLLSGASPTAISKIYRNDGSDLFTDSGISLTGVRDSAVAWGDYDNDGNEDIILTGGTENVSALAIIYHNNGNSTFTDIGAGLTGVADGAVAWGDYDNDGDADLLINGKDENENATTLVYTNDRGSFTLFPTDLPAVSLGSASWGDYDGDYDLDILMTGLADNRIVTGVYRNYDCPSDVAINQRVTPTVVLSSQPVTFTLTFTNSGPFTATRVIISDVLPSAITNVQIVSTTIGSGVSIVNSGATPPYGWQVSDLLVNEGGVMTITGDLNPTPGTIYRNTARIAAAKDITFTNNTATVAITVPFQIVQTTPPGNGSLLAHLNDTIRATFDAALNQNSATDATLVVYGSQSGRLAKAAPSYNVNTRTYSFRTNRLPRAGEVLSVIGAKGLLSTGGAPLVPYQWQFVANQTNPRCVGDFTPMAPTLPAIQNGDVAWGDYDMDGLVDLFITGQSSGGRLSRLYHNDGDGNFSVVNGPFANVDNSMAAWGDYDRDGDLDLLLSGNGGSALLINLYRNNGGTFTAVSTTLPAVTNGAVAWADYDNDGDLDILVAGNSTAGRITRLYANTNNQFAAVNAGLPGIDNGVALWGDYNNDGDLDLLLSGDSDGGRLTEIYTNHAGVFTASNAGLTAVNGSAAAWSDYDNDHDLDLIITGNTGGGRLTQLYQNNSGSFSALNPALPQVDNGAVAWGDYDNDGHLDLLLSGATDSGRITTLYGQMGGVFTEFPANLPGVAGGAVMWGDYDDDFDLDLIVAGVGDSGALTTLRRNTNCISDLNVTKSVTPTAAVAGEMITYTISFSNAGPQPALGVVLTDLIPADLTNLHVVSATIGAGVAITDTNAATGKRWQVSDLAIGAGGMITLTAEVLPGTPGVVFTNTAIITAIHDITLTNNLANALVGRPFHITATVPSSPTLVNVPLRSLIQATFDADVLTSTVAVTNVAIYGQQSGLHSGVVSYDSLRRTLTFTASTPMHHGEVVNVIGKAGLQSVAGAPLTPYQWQYVAGRYVDERCISTFEPINTALPALTRGAMDWGDYDKDGDLDVVVLGSPDGVARQSRIYRNDGNNLFTALGVTLIDLYDGAADWGDYDKDGDLDLLLSGSSAGGPTTRLYRNDGNSLFSEVPVALTGLAQSSVAWADYDNDGDLDLVVAGTADDASGSTRLYRNDGANLFTLVNAGLVGIYRGAVAWADADGDGDLDLLLTGTTDGATGVSRLYRNDGGHFTDLALSLPSLYDSAVAWGDYDSDGDPDFLLLGTSDGSSRFTTLYRNDGANLFSAVTTNITGLSQGSVAWGDYDNDNRLDLLLTGTANGATPVTKLLNNRGLSGFVDAPWTIDNAFHGAVSWHDYDGDGDLDLLLQGSGDSGPIVRLYRNNDCVSDLTLSKTVNQGTVLPGAVVTYTLAFSNIGPETATRIRLTDTLPLDKLADVSYVSSVPVTVTSGAPYVWRLPNIAPGQGGTLTVRGRTTFTATGTTFANTATIRAREDITVTNDTDVASVTVQAPQVSFANREFSVDEANGQATITVKLDIPNPAGNVTVLYQSTTQGTATAGSDYTAVNATLVIPAGQTSATFTVPITDDMLDEDDETVVLALSSPAGAVLGSVTTATLKIVDNDPAPSLTINDVTLNESGGDATFIITLGAQSGRAVTVTVNTADNSATAGADYTAIVNLTVVIPAGQTSAAVIVKVIDDSSKEEDEQFFVNLNNPINATLADSQGVGVITDNDGVVIYMPYIRK